ncbi:MAG: helix-turn-helix domain-containing protein [Sporolactobacillus sp.]
MSELGQVLKETREKKGLSLDEVQEETKIQKRYLQSIETGDFGQLPGKFYTRAFIKSYAEALGIDFSTFAEEHADEMPKLDRDEPVELRTAPPDGGEEPAAKSVRRTRQSSSSVNWSSVINKTIIVVFTLIVLMLVYILISHVAGNQNNRASRQSAGTSVSFKGSSTKNASSSAASSSSTASSASSSSSSDAQQLKQDQVQGNRTTYTLTGTTKFNVTVASKTGQNAWFMATDAKTGKQLAQGTVSAAGKKSYKFDASQSQSLQIQFGSVPNTSLKINGKTFKFPNQNTVQYIIINFSK